ncbi:MAG: FliH/SctL family protein [Acidobacteriota bacterium]
MSSSRIIKGRGHLFPPYFWDEVATQVESHPVWERASDPDSTAQASTEEALNAAYHRGFQAGENAAKASLDATISATAAELARSANDLAQLRPALFRSAQLDLTRLSIAIARRILHRELIVAPDALEGIISVTLSQLKVQDVHQLRVNPLMVPRIEDQLNRIASCQTIQVAGDPSLGLGGCVFDTKRGSIDPGIDTQLSEIERGLADQIEIRR